MVGMGAMLSSATTMVVSIVGARWLGQRPSMASARMLATAQRTEMVHDNAFLTSSSQRDDVALVLLNSPNLLAGERDRLLFSQMWSLAKVRICADGAANRLFDFLGNECFRATHMPDLIRGDLDSLRGDVRSFYEGRGVSVERDGCQDTHDMDKCLKALEEYSSLRKGVAAEEMKVVVLGAFGGRMDHVMANLNMLFCRRAFGRMVLLSSDSLAMFLPPGEHLVHPNRAMEGPTCALVPLGAPCPRVTTSGLRWNLSEGELRFGGLVSTSNEFGEDPVRVRTEGAGVVWISALGQPR